MCNQFPKALRQLNLIVAVRLKILQEKMVEKLGMTSPYETLGMVPIIQARMRTIEICLFCLVSYAERGGGECRLSNPLSLIGTISRIVSDMDRAIQSQNTTSVDFFSPIEYVEEFLVGVIERLSLDSKFNSCDLGANGVERHDIFVSINQLIGAMAMFTEIVRFSPVLAKELFVSALSHEQ